MAFPPIGISSYPIRIDPLTNIAPFTYRSGETYLTMLYRLKDYIEELSPQFNTKMGEMIEILNAGIAGMEQNNAEALAQWNERFNAAIAAINDGWVSEGEYGHIVHGFTAADAQAAIDAAAASDATNRSVYFPPGDYNLVERVKLRGGITYTAHRDAVFRKSDNSTGGYAVFYTGSDGAKGYGSGASNWKWYGGTFKGDFANNNAVCAFALHHSDNFRIEGILHTQANFLGHSIDLLGCSNFRITGNTLEGFKNNGGGWTKEEAIQLDVSSAGSSSATDLPGSYDGLPCIDGVIDYNVFRPITIGGVTYAAPNPIGAHATFETAAPKRIRFANNRVVDPQLDQTSDMRGVLHFLGVDGLDVIDNTFEYTTPNNTVVLGLYSTDQGIRASGANYDVGATNTLATLTTPLVCRNVRFKGNKLKGFANVNGTGGVGNITVNNQTISSTPVMAENLDFSGNEFEMLNTGTGTPNSIYLKNAVNVSVGVGGRNVFTGPTRPVDASNVNRMVWGDNVATGARADAFRLDTGDSLRVRGVDTKGSAGTSVYVSNATGVGVSDNFLESLAGGRGAVAFNNVNGFNVHDNAIKAPAGTAGVEAYTGSANGQIHHNRISGGTTTHVLKTDAAASVTETDNIKL